MLFLWPRERKIKSLDFFCEVISTKYCLQLIFLKKYFLVDDSLIVGGYLQQPKNIFCNPVLVQINLSALLKKFFLVDDFLPLIVGYDNSSALSFLLWITTRATKNSHISTCNTASAASPMFQTYFHNVLNWYFHTKNSASFHVYKQALETSFILRLQPVYKTCFVVPKWDFINTLQIFLQSSGW